MNFAATLLSWFASHRRPLPWRDTRDAYAIWLSEVILQQTRIEQGMPYWQRFIDRWPRVEMLAEASEDEVLRLWQGLGYYSRARHLLTAARQVVAMGGFPTTFEGLRGLKGVGDYTAAAIASIAFDQPVAVVDGNVYRVLSRHFGISTPINSTEGKHEFQALAQQLLPERQAADFNQAMMDFGATLCTPQSPRCQECPLADTCIALHERRVAQLPVKQRTLHVRDRHFLYIYIRCKGHTAIHQRPAGDIWQGLWEPLNVELSAPVPAPSSVYEDLQSIGWAPSALQDALCIARGVKHVLTHRRLFADFYLLDCPRRPALPDGFRWIEESEIDRFALPRLVEKLLEALPITRI